MPLFGVLSSRGHGHAVTTILLAMIAMLFTAISYGRMARVYPSAGSAFTYVGQEINPAVPTENLVWPQKDRITPYNNVTCLAFPSSHVDMDVADS